MLVIELSFSRHVEKTFASFSRHGRHGGCGRCRGYVGHGWWWRCRREEELQFCHLSGRCPSSHTVFPDERVFRQLSVSHLLLTRIPVVRTLRHAVDIEVQAYYGLWRRWRHGSLIHGLRLTIRLLLRLTIRLLLRLTIRLLLRLTIRLLLRLTIRLLLRLTIRLLRLTVRLLLRLALRLQLLADFLLAAACSVSGKCVDAWQSLARSLTVQEDAVCAVRIVVALVEEVFVAFLIVS